MAIAIGHRQISPSPATLTPLFELESTSVDNEVPVEKSPRLLLGLNLSSRSPQVDPTESFDVWTVALQDGPDVHATLSYAMHAPEQRYHLFEHEHLHLYHYTWAVQKTCMASLHQEHGHTLCPDREVSL